MTLNVRCVAVRCVLGPVSTFEAQFSSKSASRPRRLVLYPGRSSHRLFQGKMTTTERLRGRRDSCAPPGVQPRVRYPWAIEAESVRDSQPQGTRLTCARHVRLQGRHPPLQTVGSVRAHCFVAIAFVTAPTRTAKFPIGVFPGLQQPYDSQEDDTSQVPQCRCRDEYKATGRRVARLDSLRNEEAVHHVRGIWSGCGPSDLSDVGPTGSAGPRRVVRTVQRVVRGRLDGYGSTSSWSGQPAGRQRRHRYCSLPLCLAVCTLDSAGRQVPRAWQEARRSGTRSVAPSDPVARRVSAI
ncbi:hypothetical protein C8Q77DRAFT_300943 [Trametes polyzona]|nr:hypothetical protein C8Q77DRAFT_300943 [Trametes polyzona]